MSSNSTTNNVSFWITKKPYIAWIAAAIFYFYQYMLRVSPGIMVYEIRSSFLVKAEEFATLGSIYLLLYSLSQIPLGLLVDRFGVKKIISISVTLCVIGSFLSSIATSFTTMQLSRALIGTGSAAAFMISLKIVADNFSPGKRGFLMGATLTLGTAGAIFSSKIVAIMLEHFHWQYVWQVAGFLGLAILVICIIFVPSKQEKVYKNVTSKKKEKNVILDIIQVLKDKNVVIYSILAIGLYTPLAAIADLWGTAFIVTKFGFEKDIAASSTMMLYLGLAIGSIMLPWFFERNSLLNLGIKCSVFCILILFAIILYGPKLNVYVLTSLFIIIGIFCGSEIMCFTAALRYANANNSGEIIGVVNTLNMLGGALLQQLIGQLLDINWGGVIDQYGVRIYSTYDFTISLSAIIILIFYCWLISLVLDKKQ